MSSWSDERKGYAGPPGLLRPADLERIRQTLGDFHSISVTDARGLLAHIDKLQHSLDQLESRWADPAED